MKLTQVKGNTWVLEGFELIGWFESTTFHQSEKTFQKECLFCFGERQVADSKGGS